MVNPLQLRALSPPPWLGPHAILEAVRWLVVNDTSKADAGWTLQDIKAFLTVKLAQRQRQRQETDDDILRVQLAMLVNKGDLKLVGIRSEEHYTLSPPHLPPWFGPEIVLQEAVVLDQVNACGWDWSQMRDKLKERAQPLPPDFDSVLRAMLFTLHRRGHLIVTRGSTSGGPCLYKRRQAPPLVEGHPVDMPRHIWCYLGYKLGAGDAFDGSDPGEQIRDEDALAQYIANAPDCFAPGAVLEEVEWLWLHNSNNNPFGWTLEEIRNSLMHRHQLNQQAVPQGIDLDTMLWVMLTSLSNKGYIEVSVISPRRYKVVNTPPRFPPWFGTQVVLQAVQKLDSLNDRFYEEELNDSGSTWQQIKEHLLQANQQPLPGFDRVLQTTLCVLRQRGHLTWGGSGPHHFTRRHARATMDIPDDLLCYYVGYKLGAGYGGLDDDVEEFDKLVNDGLRRRRNIPTTTEKESLLPPTRRSVDDEAERKEKRKQRRKLYLIWSMFVSICGHAMFGLSFLPILGEETNNKLLRWGVMSLIVPLLLLAAMIGVQISFLDLEEASLDENHVKAVKRNKLVNMLVLAVSKIVYGLMKEFPGPTVALQVIAHAVDILIDLGGSYYLYRKLSYLDQELI